MTIGLADLPGLWRRSLLAWPDGRRDQTTDVYWLQAASLYADLRVPPGRPDFSGIEDISGLDWPHIRWLARQEGFAGRLSFDGTFFQWQREIDFQPSAATPDAGRLWFENGIMIEEGRYVPYVEHWHREDAPSAGQCAAAVFRNDMNGQRAITVRAGAWMMLARGRGADLPAGGTLVECVNDLPIVQARALVDFEISVAAMAAGNWRVVRSSLPFLESQNLALPSAAAGWRIESGEGDLAALSA